MSSGGVCLLFDAVCVKFSCQWNVDGVNGIGENFLDVFHKCIPKL